MFVYLACLVVAHEGTCTFVCGVMKDWSFSDQFLPRAGRE